MRESGIVEAKKESFRGRGVASRAQGQSENSKWRAECAIGAENSGVVGSLFYF